MTSYDLLRELITHLEWLRDHGRKRVQQTRLDKTLYVFNQGRVDAAESALQFVEDLRQRNPGVERE